jgi:Ca2+-binding EF-hand superfamily protein
VPLFKSVDGYKDGIINEEQLRYLIQEMKIIPVHFNDSNDKLEEEIEKLLILIDPHKTQKITFSELVTFLTLTELKGENINKDLREVVNPEQDDLLRSHRNTERQEKSENIDHILLHEGQCSISDRYPNKKKPAKLSGSD